jgi:hypothetical protein
MGITFTGKNKSKGSQNRIICGPKKFENYLSSQLNLNNEEVELKSFRLYAMKACRGSRAISLFLTSVLGEGEW